MRGTVAVELRIGRLAGTVQTVPASVAATLIASGRAVAAPAVVDADHDGLLTRDDDVGSSRQNPRPARGGR